MSEIVVVSLSAANHLVSHLCQFLKLDTITAGEVRNSVSNQTGFGFALAHAIDLGNPVFATWQRRVSQTVHVRALLHADSRRGRKTRFQETAVATELGIQTMLEMFTESKPGCSDRLLVQWIDSIEFSYRIDTRLTAGRLHEILNSKMTRLDHRIRVNAITGPNRNTFIVHCEIAAVWELPARVIALKNVDDAHMAVVPFVDGTPSPRTDTIRLTVLSSASAIDLIRSCNFVGVTVNNWRGGRQAARDRSAARSLIVLSTRARVFKTRITSQKY